MSPAHDAVKLFHPSKTKKQIQARTKPISQGGENSRKQRYGAIVPGSNKWGSIMWSIVTALIYWLIIVPGWRLTSRDMAKVRGAGFKRSLHRPA
jgi:hypothetical protein